MRDEGLWAGFRVRANSTMVKSLTFSLLFVLRTFSFGMTKDSLDSGLSAFRGWHRFLALRAFAMVLRALHCGEVQGTRASAEGSPGQTTRVLRLCDSLQGSFVRLAWY